MKELTKKERAMIYEALSCLWAETYHYLNQFEAPPKTSIDVIQRTHTKLKDITDLKEHFKY